MVTKLKALFQKIPTKAKGTFALLIIVALLIWFILPMIPIGGVHPFSTVTARLIVISVLVVLYVVKLLIDIYQKHKNKSFGLASDKVKKTYQVGRNVFKNLWHWSIDGLKELKYRFTEERKRRRLRKQPWYLVLGTPGSGKKHTLGNTGLSYARAEHFGEEAAKYIQQCPDVDWWFSEEAVLVDVMTYQKETDAASWRKLLKLLKKERSAKPLNGILLTLSLPDLVVYSNKQRQEFVQEVCQYIRDIHSTFKSLVPVYIIFNKCDLVEGFMEFFNDISREELRQVWGMTFPLEISSDSSQIQHFFQQEYDKLTEHLRNRAIWAMEGEQNSRGKELIHTFPQQMQLLKKPIEMFIAELFVAVRYPKALQLRGCYFTSCDQQYGEPFDFVLQAMSKKFQLVPPQFERERRRGDSYFVKGLFRGVIFPEAPIMGDSERSKRNRRIAYTSTLAAFPIILVLAIIGMQQGYEENLVNLKLVDQDAGYYQEALAGVKPDDGSLLPLLPALDQLNAARDVYVNDSSWGLDFLFATARIQTDLSDALQRSLHLYFLPRIAAQIEAALNQNIQDNNVLYATLKGYLAFSANSNASPVYVKAPMEYTWDQSYVEDPKTETKLKYYLSYAVNAPIEKVPLDEALIDRVRGQLEQIIPSNRAYGLLQLRTTVSDTTPLAIANEVGSAFYQVFVEQDPKLNNVPALYTAQGFNNVFLEQYEKISDEVAKDNQDIGLVNDKDTAQSSGQISDIMQTTYNTNYTNTWNAALGNISVKPFSSINDAINVLNVLVSSDSPMPKLLNVIYDNTSTVSHDKVQVSSYYDNVNEYGHNDYESATWSDTVKNLVKVRDYFVTLQQAANQNQAAFDAAQSAIQGTNSPIQALSVEAANAPEPVKGWLNSIVNNCWMIILQSAHAQMNDAWANQVMINYNTGVKDRYPLNATADSQVSIDDFNNMFGNGGSLQKYFNQYIKPFVDTSGQNWKLYSVNGHSIEIPQQDLDVFKQVEAVRTDYFPNGAATSTFKFSIEPMTLDSNASSIQMTIGGQQLDYSHGPQMVNTVVWPLPINQQQASVAINDFNGEQYGASANGPWALFKLFDKGNLTAAADNGTYTFTVQFNGYSATYQIIGTANINAFNLSDLKGLSLPDVIAPDALNNASANDTASGGGSS